MTSAIAHPVPRISGDTLTDADLHPAAAGGCWPCWKALSKWQPNPHPCTAVVAVIHVRRKYP